MHGWGGGAVKHACSVPRGTYPLLTFSPGVGCMNSCSVCLEILPPEQVWSRAGWSGAEWGADGAHDCGLFTRFVYFDERS